MTPEQEKLIEGLKELQEHCANRDWAEEAAAIRAAIAELERLIAENKKLKQARKTPKSELETRIEKAINECESGYGDFYIGQFAEDIVGILEGSES
jgi:transcription elongation GreA/GreB family factor